MPDRSGTLSYALITAARNEEKLIRQTIESVIAQTVRPVRWVIVSDGSTDRTDEIVMEFVAWHSWIELLRMPKHRDRSFAAKAGCFNAGLLRLDRVSFDIVGNLDADITFDPDYYDYLLTRFAEDPRLGVAGTPYIEDPTRPDLHTYAHRFADLHHVSGACQMFRKQCFAEVGGYTPIRGGGIDWVAVTSARMNRWKTQTFLGRVCVHHRAMGTADRSPLRARFRHGQEDYLLGGHPAWQLVRGLFQMKNKPIVLGGLSLIAGYTWALLTRKPRPISDDLMRFHRAEQVVRLRSMVAHALRHRTRPAGAPRE